MTTLMAAIPPVERPLWEDDEAVADVADDEEFVVVLEVCGGMVWLKGMRKLNCFLLD
jgi:hypothetical protein